MSCVRTPELPRPTGGMTTFAFPSLIMNTYSSNYFRAVDPDPHRSAFIFPLYIFSHNIKLFKKVPVPVIFTNGFLKLDPDPH